MHMESVESWRPLQAENTDVVCFESLVEFTLVQFSSIVIKL